MFPRRERVETALLRGVCIRRVHDRVGLHFAIPQGPPEHHQTLRLQSTFGYGCGSDDDNAVSAVRLSLLDLVFTTLTVSGKPSARREY